jgi:hypothetical protein
MQDIKKSARNNACYLAAICAVEDVSQRDYEDLEREFNRIEQTLGLTKANDQAAELFPWTTKLLQLFRGALPLPASTASPNLSGRGILLVTFCSCSHAVAFHDGMVYDPDAVLDGLRPGPLPYAEWMKSSKPFQVVSIGRKPKRV